MPLPPALAARLAKRGIISEPPKEVNDEEEEVIAEDYDEHGIADLQQNYIHNKYGGRLVTEEQKSGFLGCPNKWNLYHECIEYCQKRWGTGRDPDPRVEVKRLRMLEKYPLPSTWTEVFDPGTGRYYYWNTESELVAWLPPGHPRHMPGASAAALREQIKLLEEERLKEKLNPPPVIPEPTDDPPESESDQEMSDEEEDEPERDHDWRDRERDRDRDSRRADRDTRDRRSRESRDQGRESRDQGREFREPRDPGRESRESRDQGRQRRRADDLDPMDPAAYSDTPRGTWSSGLERDVKSGVDSTASGPLFQQRPYPSPGAVLRANAESRK